MIPSAQSMKMLLLSTALVLFYSMVPGVEHNFADLSERVELGSWHLSESLIIENDASPRLVLSKIYRVEDVVENNARFIVLEVERQEYFLASNGERKKKGPVILLKSQISEELFREHYITITLNPVKWAKHLVLKVGLEDPVIIEKTNLEQLHAIIGNVPDFNYTYTRMDRIDVPPGTYTCYVFEAETPSRAQTDSPDTQANSPSSIWVHKNIPFGTIQHRTTFRSNQKTYRIESRMIDFGYRGAFSQFIKRSNKKSPFSSLSNLIWGTHDGNDENE